MPDRVHHRPPALPLAGEREVRRPEDLQLGVVGEQPGERGRVPPGERRIGVPDEPDISRLGLLEVCGRVAVEESGVEGGAEGGDGGHGYVSWGPWLTPIG